MRQQQVSVRAAAAFAFLALIVALGSANCGGGTGDQNDASTADVTTNACGPGSAVMCNGTCVDTQSDFQNCGTCGTVCPDSQVCSHGACATVCGGGASRCGNNCVDLKADVNNCGGCNKKCDSGQVCTSGSCALTCESGLTDCNGDCVDITSDDRNCNGCAMACSGGQQCVNSACQATCQTGWSSCADGDAGATKCVDTTDDPNNCGMCGKTCQPGYFCSQNNCGLNCAGGTSLCSNACVDENIDSNHCGNCSTVCGTGTACSGAHCCATATPYYCAAESKCDTISNCVLKSGGAITAGPSHTCAINGSGALKCWGYNSDGELGNGSTSSFNTAQQVTGLTSGVAATAAWYYGTCATLGSGAENCWGANFYGQLGNGMTSASTSPVTVSSISTALLPGGGGYYGGNCVLLKSGGVDCWGYDEYGALALGSITYTDYTSPQVSKVTSAIAIAGSSTNFEGNLCAVLNSGAVECWGYNSYSLGDGSTTESGAPITVGSVSNAAQVAVGEQNVCVVAKDGTMKCWGYNYYGTVGDGGTTTTYNAVTASITGVVQVSIGAYHTCVVTTGGAVECIGYNVYGQLGNGTTSSTATTTWQTAIASGAIGVACGNYHTCALTAGGKAYCWGYNTYGQVGDATNTNKSSPTLVSGF